MITSGAIKLNTGALMPIIGLGTWRIQPDRIEETVKFALQSGYRHIDTATNFGNEKEVGDGLRASGVPRSGIFLTTKLDNTDHHDVEGALLRSVKALGTYVDLWLMHWPVPLTKDGKIDKSIDWLDTWKAMEAVLKKHQDKVKAIGVSNFSLDYLERLLPEAKVIPAVNQLELHPACPQEELVTFCRSKGIAVTAYSPLGSEDSALLALEPVTRLARKKNRVSPANILISLQVNRAQVSVLVKSTDPEHIVKNLELVDLSDEEVAELQELDRTYHFRANGPEWTGGGHLGFPDCKQDLVNRYPQGGHSK